MIKKMFVLLLFLSVLSANEGGEFYSALGKCKIKFPVFPQYVRDKTSESDMPICFDTYLSKKDNDEKYLLLIAHYPLNIEKNCKEAVYEKFMNQLVPKDGVLTSAQLKDTKLGKIIEFSINHSATDFMGRVLIHEDKLYLIGVENKKDQINPESYFEFVNSFELMNK